MRKALGLALVLLMLVWAPASAQEMKTKGDPIVVLTGELWQKSSPEEKRAFFFGVDTVVAIEYAIRAKIKEERRAKGEQGERRHHAVVSPFERGWKRALSDMPRSELIAKVDAWYAEHPNSIEKPVMQVVWDEFIQPRLAELRKARRAERGRTEPQPR